MPEDPAAPAEVRCHLHPDIRSDTRTRLAGHRPAPCMVKPSRERRRLRLKAPSLLSGPRRGPPPKFIEVLREQNKADVSLNPAPLMRHPDSKQEADPLIGKASYPRYSSKRHLNTVGSRSQAFPIARHKTHRQTSSSLASDWPRMPRSWHSAPRPRASARLSRRLDPGRTCNSICISSAVRNCKAAAIIEAALVIGSKPVVTIQLAVSFAKSEAVPAARLHPEPRASSPGS